MALRALIIANGDFADSRIPPLKSPVTDAQRLQSLLSRDDVGPYAVELCANLDSYVLRQTVERFFKDAEFDDRQLLFFSGHGFKHGADGRLYFGTHDTAKEQLRSTSLAARFVFEEASTSIAQQTIIFIDSCYSGAFVKGQMLKASDHVIARDDFDVDGAHGMAVITASSSVQTASEIAVGDYVQSVFTRHLIEGIETGQADREQSGRINLDGLMRYVRTNMRKDVPNQEPMPHFFGLDGSIEVARNPVKPVEVVPEITLPKRLLKKIASANYTTRRTACAELYHHADGNTDAVDLVRVELQQLTRDPHDHVKDEARHQLSRLERRFLGEGVDDAGSGDASVQPVSTDSQSKKPTPTPPPPMPLMGPGRAKLPKSDEVTPAPVAAPPRPDTPPVQSNRRSDAAKPGTPSPPQLPGSAGARRSKVTPKPKSSWRKYLWICIGSLVVLLVFFWYMGQPPAEETGAAPPVTAKLDQSAGGRNSSGQVVRLDLRDFGAGGWLIGEWVVNQRANRCDRRVEIRRGEASNALVFRTYGAGGSGTYTDSFTVEPAGAAAAALVTSTTRYRHFDAAASADPAEQSSNYLAHERGYVQAQPIGGGSVVELSVCAS